MALQIIYTTRRGASCVRQFSAPSRVDDVLRFLKTLRCTARVVVPHAEDPIGGVWDVTGYADDKRLKWSWWLDHEAASAALGDDTESEAP